MSKYIDADKLWERLKSNMVHHIVTNTLFNTIKAVIDGMPSIDIDDDTVVLSVVAVGRIKGDKDE